MADILFVTPNMDGTVSSEHIGTLLLATILRNKGLDPTILQFFRFGDAHEDFPGFVENALNQICANKPKIISFYTRCDTFHVSLLLAQKLRALLPESYIVFGGPHSDICAEDILSQIPWVDFVCCGEGENTIFPLFSSLLADNPDLSVPGLVYRSGCNVIKNPRPQFVDLDTLPHIDYSLTSLSIDPEKDKAFSIDVGRGCPFGCTFCSTKSFWGRTYRLKSPRRIVEEMQSIHDRFGFTTFIFEHDMFTMKRSQVIETCRLIKQLDFSATWMCSARLDCIDRDLIDIMADAGLTSIYFGIETGSPRMQKLINKNLNTENLMDILSYVHKKGLQITTSFIFGFPEETEEDISQTISMMGRIAQLKNVMIQAHPCTFLPGTEITNRYRDLLIPSDTRSDITGNIGYHECKDLVLSHPSLFLHLQEHKTVLRTALRFLPRFILLWNSMQPLYQYISQMYPTDRIVDMYYDFVEANKETLCSKENEKKVYKTVELLENDRFISRFCDDKNYDIMEDYRRIKLVEYGALLHDRNSDSAIYCISPAQIKSDTRLEDYTRGIFAVTHVKKPDGSVSHRIRSMNP